MHAKYTGAKIAPDEFIQPELAMYYNGNETGGVAMTHLNIKQLLRNITRLKKQRDI